MLPPGMSLTEGIEQFTEDSLLQKGPVNHPRRIFDLFFGFICAVHTTRNKKFTLPDILDLVEVRFSNFEVCLGFPLLFLDLI